MLQTRNVPGMKCGFPERKLLVIRVYAERLHIYGFHAKNLEWGFPVINPISRVFTGLKEGFG